MKDLVCSKREFLKGLKDNPFIRNVVDNGSYITWNEPHKHTHFILDKRIPTYLTSTQVGQIYKKEYGTKPKASDIDFTMQKLGYEIAKIDNKKVYLNCVLR